MGLFRKQKTSRRARRRAEAAALKHKAGLEAKLGAKNTRTQAKRQAKAQVKAAKIAAKAQKAEAKALAEASRNEVKIAEAEQAAAEAGKFNARTVTRYLGIARVLAPVLMPVAYRGTQLLRGELDKRRADRLGVPVTRVADFSGHGAELSARIAGAERALAHLSADNGKDPATQTFVADSTRRLADLASAVSAAEPMSPDRRRAAFDAVSTELDGLEADVLDRLGVR